MNVMNILYIASSGVLGGATKSFLEMVLTIAALSQDINITVCTNEYNEINKILKENNIKSIADGHIDAMEVMPCLPNKYRMLRRHIKRSLVFYKSEHNALKEIEAQLDVSSFDLIHSNTARNDIGCILANKYHIPHIMHIREFGTDDFNCWNLRRNYCDFLNANVDVFIAISKAVKNSWSRKGIDDKKIIIIYNGIDAQKIEKSDPEHIGNPLKMVIAGGVCAPKGQYQIIEAINYLPSEIKNNVTLDIYGWGDKEYIQSLNNRVHDLKLESQIKFDGPVDEMYSKLRFYDIGLTCSKAEGFGRVTAEYMHAGLGVIVSDTGANKELVDDGNNGLIYKYGDSRNLAEKIITFYNDRKLLKACAKSAMEKASDYYTKENNAREILKLYKRVLCK